MCGPVANSRFTQPLTASRSGFREGQCQQFSETPPFSKGCCAIVAVLHDGPPDTLNPLRRLRPGAESTVKPTAPYVGLVGPSIRGLKSDYLDSVDYPSPLLFSAYSIASAGTSNSAMPAFPL